MKAEWALFFTFTKCLSLSLGIVKKKTIANGENGEWTMRAHREGFVTHVLFCTYTTADSPFPSTSTTITQGQGTQQAWTQRIQFKS